MNKIELTDEELKLFTLFKKHQGEFQILLKEGFFEPYLGKMEIHKDGIRIRMVIPMPEHKY